MNEKNLVVTLTDLSADDLLKIRNASRGNLGDQPPGPRYETEMKFDGTFEVTALDTLLKQALGE